MTVENRRIQRSIFKFKWGYVRKFVYIRLFECARRPLGSIELAPYSPLVVRRQTVFLVLQFWGFTAAFYWDYFPLRFDTTRHTNVIRGRARAHANLIVIRIFYS